MQVSPLLLSTLITVSPSSSLLQPCYHAQRPHYSRALSQLSYKPVDSENGDGTDNNVWTVLANTERWISDTLDRSNKSAAASSTMASGTNDKDNATAKKMHFADEKKQQQPSIANNPYARKEVSYVCETGGDLATVVGGIFRRVREARELGERHGKMSILGQPTTMRSTNVLVIPNCEELLEFRTFDNLVQAINQARRKARDFVTKVDGKNNEKAFVVSINCAHLHPQFGVKTSAETLAAMKQEEEEGIVDVNLQEYKKRRDEARRSPYPSVIVEVQSTPPPDFGSESTSNKNNIKRSNMNVDRDEGVTVDDVKRLESLFGMSAASKKADDRFYDALGEAFGKKQIEAQTPLSMAQHWVLSNDPAFDAKSSTFTTSDTRHVDAAYEYVFNTIAMIAVDSPKHGQKSYVVLPNFLPTSATSFDRFGGQVSNIIRVMPNLTEKILISTFHPEHVDAATRSPVPIFVVTWK